MKFALATDENFKGQSYKALESWLGEGNTFFAPNAPVEVPADAAQFIIEKAPELRPADEEAKKLQQAWLEKRQAEMCADCFALSPYIKCGHVSVEPVETVKPDKRARRAQRANGG